MDIQVYIKKGHLGTPECQKWATQASVALSALEGRREVLISFYGDKAVENFDKQTVRFNYIKPNGKVVDGFENTVRGEWVYLEDVKDCFEAVLNKRGIARSSRMGVRFLSGKNSYAKRVYDVHYCVSKLLQELEEKESEEALE